MIPKDVYDKLKKYSDYASWAVWKAPDDGNWRTKDGISDMSVFDNARIEALLESLNGDFILIGLNPAEEFSTRDPWRNFHVERKGRSWDHKLRSALHDTHGWGSLIMDVLPDTVTPRGAEAIKQSKGNDLTDSINRIKDARQILGGKAVLIAMGRKAEKILRKQLPDMDIKYVPHYSGPISYDKLEEKFKDNCK